MKQFLKTPYFWVLSLVLLSVLCSFILIYMGCFAYIFIPIFMFAVPFWLREKRMKRFLLNGIIVGILMVFIADVVYTSAVLGPDFEKLPDRTQGAITLSQGSVSPYKASGSTDFNFSVVYKNTTPAQITDTAEEDGWKVKAGVTTFDWNNGTSIAMLTSISGYGRVVSIAAVTDNQAYASAIQALLGSVEMKKPATATATTSAATASAKRAAKGTAKPAALQGYMEYHPFTKAWTWKVRYPPQ